MTLDQAQNSELQIPVNWFKVAIHAINIVNVGIAGVIAAKNINLGMATIAWLGVIAGMLSATQSALQESSNVAAVTKDKLMAKRNP